MVVYLLFLYPPCIKGITKCILILCFSGRYLHFAEQLTSCGFGVYAMDWIGKETYLWFPEHVLFCYIKGNVTHGWFGGRSVLYLEIKSMNDDF